MSPSFQFFDFVYIKTNNNPFLNKVLYLKNNYQDLHTTTLKLTKSSGEERGTSFYSPLWSQFKKFRISKFYFFFISLYGLTTVNMCIRFKIAHDMVFFAESCLQDLQIFRALPWVLFGKLIAHLYDLHLKCLPVLLFTLAPLSQGD